MTNVTTHRITSLIAALRIREKEGLSLNAYLQAISPSPHYSWAVYAGEESGIPSRKFAILKRFSELESCAALMEFMDDIIMCKEHLDSYFAYEIARDLEASIYLSIAGHYRQAIALLRFALENALLAQFAELYGHNDSQSATAKMPIGGRLVDRLFPPSSFLRGELKRIYRVLSQHVHTSTRRAAHGSEHIKFDESLFDTGYQLYLDVARLITLVLHAYWPSYRLRRPRWGLFEGITGLSEEMILTMVWQELET